MKSLHFDPLVWYLMGACTHGSGIWGDYGASMHQTTAHDSFGSGYMYPVSYLGDHMEYPDIIDVLEVDNLTFDFPAKYRQF